MLASKKCNQKIIQQISLNIKYLTGIYQYFQHNQNFI